MQTSVFPREADLIPFLICCCLISILAWNIFLISSNVLWTLSIPETTATEGSTENRSDLQHPWDRQPEGNQLLSRNIAQKYKPFPWKFNSSIYELPQRVRETAAIDNDVDKSLLEEVFKVVHKFLLTTSGSNLEDSQEIGNAPRTIHQTTIARGIEKEAQMEGFPNERSIDGITVKMNTEDTVEEAERETLEETNSAEQSIRQETSLKAAVAFEETFGMLLSTSADQFEGKSANDGAALEGNSYKSRDQREEYAKIERDREEGADAAADDNEDDPWRIFGAYLQIKKGDLKESAKGHSAESKMKIEERPETGASSFVTANSSASSFQKSNGSEVKSSKHSAEKIITSEACPLKGAVYPFENESTKKVEKCGTFSFESRFESRLKMAVDRLEERLRENAEICSKEGDYLGEQFGMIPEKEGNCTEEKSIMHLEKNTTQPQGGKEERVLGLPPAVELLKNSLDAECTMSLVGPSATNHGKEEEDLNTMIRRLIVTELKKHRQKKHTMLKRAYSDTESLLPKNRSSARDRADLLNLKDRTFFQNLLELEESLRKRSEDKSDTESMDNRFDGIAVKEEDSVNEDASPSRNDDSACATVPEASNGPEKGTNQKGPAVTCVAVSNILLERKANVHCLVDGEEGKQSDAEKSLATRVPAYASKSTQTEHVYVIRAVRSCPLRKRRLSLQMQLQLHQLPLGHDAVCSKTVYASPDFTQYIFRKASDNLIYEKSKGDRSPSYVSSPERFRWRYLAPSKVTRKDHLVRSN